MATRPGDEAELQKREAVGVILLFLRPIYTIASADIYADYLQERNEPLLLPTTPPKVVSVIVAVLVLFLIIGATVFYRDPLGITKWLSTPYETQLTADIQPDVAQVPDSFQQISAADFEARIAAANGVGYTLVDTSVLTPDGQVEYADAALVHFDGSSKAQVLLPSIKARFPDILPRWNYTFGFYDASADGIIYFCGEAVASDVLAYSCPLFRYEIASDQLTPVEVSNYWYTAGSAQSPSSKLIAVGLPYRQSDADEGYRTLYIFDFIKDTITPLVVLPVGQTLASRFNAFDGGAVADLRWIDTQTVEYGVYVLPNPPATEPDAPNTFVERKRVSLPQN